MFGVSLRGCVKLSNVGGRKSPEIFLWGIGGRVDKSQSCLEVVPAAYINRGDGEEWGRGQQKGRVEQEDCALEAHKPNCAKRAGLTAKWALGGN